MVLICAMLIGVLIMFGGVFHWDSGTTVSHAYTTLTVVVFTAIPICIFLNKYASILFYLVALHIFISIAFVMTYMQAAELGVLILITDTAIAYYLRNPLGKR